MNELHKLSRQLDQAADKLQALIDNPLDFSKVDTELKNSAINSRNRRIRVQGMVDESIADLNDWLNELEQNKKDFNDHLSRELEKYKNRDPMLSLKFEKPKNPRRVLEGLEMKDLFISWEEQMDSFRKGNKEFIKRLRQGSSRKKERSKELPSWRK